MKSQTMEYSPVRKYSNDVTKIQKAPGVPRLSLKSGSISILYRSEEMENSLPWRTRTTSIDEEDIEYNAALVGAPRLHLSSSINIDETLSDCNLSMRSIQCDREISLLADMVTTPGPGVEHA